MKKKLERYKIDRMKPDERTDAKMLQDTSTVPWFPAQNNIPPAPPMPDIIPTNNVGIDVPTTNV